MRTHAFADMMYHLYQCFNLFDKDDKRRETRGNSSFSYHQSFFEQGYDDVIKIIDADGVFSLEERRDIFYKYEQLYNALMHTPVFSHLDNNQILQRYLHIALPLIVAMDIYNTLAPDNEMHFYYHIHRFLVSTHCPHKRDDKRKIYVGVKNYLREYIHSLDFPYKDHLAPLFNFISDIKIGSGQREATIKRIIKNCRLEYDKSYILQKNIVLHSLSLDKIERAYLSLNVLLVFERQTSVVNAVSWYYRIMVNSGIACDANRNMLFRYLYGKGYDEKLLHCIIGSLYEIVILPVSVKIEEKPYRYIHELKQLIFNTKKNEKYSKKSLTEIESCFNATINSDFVKPYSELLQIIIFINQRKLNEAYDIVNKKSLDKLPIGYLPAAFSLIKLALRIKLKRNKIRNKSLLSDINRILCSQGVITDFIAVTQDEINSDIILCPDNITIMRTIKTYNIMLQKICSPAYFSSSICQQAISGLLDEIDYALGKINTLLHKTGDNIESNELAGFIINNKTLTTRELNENLIGVLNNCTLYNSLTCLNILINYLSCPGETLKNIRIFSGVTEKSAHLRRKVCEALKIASEKL